jgi:hypothetical protein
LDFSPSTALFILSHGYTRGFRLVFLLHASWAVAVVATIFTIKHQGLIRGDEEALEVKANSASQMENMHRDGLDLGRAVEDLEMGIIDKQDLLQKRVIFKKCIELYPFNSAPMVGYATTEAEPLLRSLLNT